MPRTIHLFDPPTRFVAGTVGLPGQRAFFLQAQDDRRLVSVLLEKEQLRLLSDRCEQLLDELVLDGDTRVPIMASDQLDLGALTSPVDEEFRVGAMGLAWNPENGLVTIEAHELPEGDNVTLPDIESDETEGPDCLRVRLSPDMARAFTVRSTRVVNAGRPLCPDCGEPIDADGHECTSA